MITVGLTGGIGSGKTTVAKAFEALGIPIYIADDEAKKLMNTSKVLKRKLIALFGEVAYKDNKLNRPYLAKAIFNNKALLEKMNAIVHPKVGKHFIKWKNKQEAPYVIKEAAILFENGSYKNYDYIITVTAPEKTRIERVLKRDNASIEKVKAIIANQWKDELKVSLSDFVIVNTNLDTTKKEVLNTHKKLLKKANKF
ncbi:dephospho-CoA kinase [Lacinutrix sp. Bg11-31]|uniref:dephospho-CoA kinase n=1 Tax=Lacinutrix sp. Bg11-31 TaxID=2057808 RepID=UPI000C30ABB1|nr:dephospho-CoA kinase [Lacinutrix sp. Bg11-31]AUC81908.1 dephospho-CoA kinase [Lacinutrix sp. Bg11-31]